MKVVTAAQVKKWQCPYLIIKMITKLSLLVQYIITARWEKPRVFFWLQIEQWLRRACSTTYLYKPYKYIIYISDYFVWNVWELRLANTLRHYAKTIQMTVSHVKDLW